jgi:hypothetical protein
LVDNGDILPGGRTNVNHLGYFGRNDRAKGISPKGTVLSGATFFEDRPHRSIQDRSGWQVRFEGKKEGRIYSISGTIFLFLLQQFQ